MFPTGYDVMTSGQSIAYAMTEEYNGTWSVVIPVPAGEWFYSFVLMMEQQLLELKIQQICH